MQEKQDQKVIFVSLSIHTNLEHEEHEAHTKKKKKKKKKIKHKYTGSMRAQISS